MALSGRRMNVDAVELADVLVVESVEASYRGATALRGVTLRVPSGSAVALLGANGAGKTTTIRAIMGLLPSFGGQIDAGRVQVRGEDVAGLAGDRVVKRGIAHVPEGRLIFSGMSIDENLDTGLAGRTTPGADDSRALVFELFPVLAERRRSAGGLLSGGEQQMLAIGRALMADPAVLLLDEVSLGLAPIVTRSILERLTSLRAATGLSMLVVEQNVALALEFTESAVVIENGRIVHEGASSAIRDDPRVQELYLGGETGVRRSFADARRLRRRRRWLS